MICCISFSKRFTASFDIVTGGGGDTASFAILVFIVGNVVVVVVGIDM
jgi:hypothetical protein